MNIKDYINEIIENHEQNEDELNLHQLCEDVRYKFKTKCTFDYVGGYESPGYDIDCYAIAFIDENGEIGIASYEKESY
jgi:hypothetical protein